MTDDDFLAGVEPYISDATIFAAHDVVNDQQTLSMACACYGARPSVVQALLGKLRGARAAQGVVRSTSEYVNPWVEVALLPDDIEGLAAFAVYRTLENRKKAPLLVSYGRRCH